jgi:CheY-like chemotaxis protein
MKNPFLEKNHRVIVIDDTRAIHADFRKILAGDGPLGKADAMELSLFGQPAEKRNDAVFKVDSAFQGKEGLDMVQRALQDGHPYAMAFMDIRMPPGWDGIETTARIWAVDPDLQIVLCTAFSDYSWSEIIERLGHTDKLLILKKPFENIEALQLAEALSEKWHLTQQARWQLANLEILVAKRTEELTAANATLSEALANVKELSGLVPICSVCKRIRDDNDYWHTVEQYLTDHTKAHFTHGICPACFEKSMRDIEKAFPAASLVEQVAEPKNETLITKYSHNLDAPKL